MTNKHFPADLHGPQLKEHLEVHADQIRQDSYVRPLSPDEITEHKSQYVEAGLEKQTLDEELAEIKKDFNAKLKDIKERFKTHGKCIRRKAIEQEGNIYVFRDTDEGRIYEYTEHGQLITDRRMNPEERQLIIPLRKNKTA